MIGLINGNAVRIPLRDESVHLVVTSPPYFGLRKYQGALDYVWGGEVGCEHLWKDTKGKAQDTPTAFAGRFGNVGGCGRIENPTERITTATGGQFCQLCNAWRGSFGLEPSPDLYIEHLVEIFREVRRVLRSDGVCLLNLGDSYATGSKGTNQGMTPQNWLESGNVKKGGMTRAGCPDGLKPKDLCLIPQRAAIALQRDGWWVRSFLPWVKSNALPESVRDRPTTAHEYWIMLTKAKRYFWDGEAVRMPNSPTSTKWGKSTPSKTATGQEATGGIHGKSSIMTSTIGNAEVIEKYYTSGRNYRTSDTFNESLNILIDEQRRYLAHLESVKDGNALVLDEKDNPLAALFNTANYGGAHFATFPAKMIEPFVKAGTSERGVCGECGGQWERIIESDLVDTDGWGPTKKNHTGNLLGAQSMMRDGKGRAGTSVNITIDWQPSCTCNAGDPIPATVFDPFIGSGTTAQVARALGRHCIGLDLSFPYLRDQARTRLELDALEAWESGVDGNDGRSLAELPLFSSLVEIPET